MHSKIMLGLVVVTCMSVLNAFESHLMLITAFIVQTSFFVMHWISTTAIKEKNIAMNGVQNTETEIKSQSSGSHGVSMHSTLCNEKALHLFMIHLSKELSNCLCFNIFKNT